MKKLFTILAVCFAVVAVNAQNVVLTEDFENGIPSTWTVIDNDGDGFEWGSTADILGDGYGHNGSTSCAYSQSYDNGTYSVLYPDNYLITPQLNLTSGAVVKLYVTAQDASYPAEHWGVFVSTTGTNPADFTEVYSETFSPSKAQAAWQEKYISLAAYTGNVYIAFKHYDCSDMYWFELDDVTVSCGNVGVEDNEAPYFAISPNPATSNLRVAGEGQVVITNIVGQVVMTDMVNGSADLNISDLESGVYVISLNGVSKKFIKK